MSATTDNNSTTDSDYVVVVDTTGDKTVDTTTEGHGHGLGRVLVPVPDPLVDVDEWYYDSEYDKVADEEEELEQNFYRSMSKNFHAHEDNQYPIVVAMAIGIPEFDNILDILSHNDFKKGIPIVEGGGGTTLTRVMPVNEELGHEICRRAYFIDKEYKGPPDLHPRFIQGKKHRRIPRPARWKTLQLMSWLQACPLVDADGKDLGFLRGKLQALRDMAMAVASDATEEELIDDPWMWREWRGITPWVRMCHVLDQDTLKDSFVKRNHPINLQQEPHPAAAAAGDDDNEEAAAADAAAAASSYWIKAADWFNDETWEPQSYVLQGWGRWFESERNLSWTTLQTLGVENVTPKQLRDKFRSLIRHLHTVVKRYTTASGTGEDSLLGKTLEIDGRELTAAEVEQLPTTAGGRKTFLRNEPPACMYLWFTLLSNGLLQHALTEIPENVPAVEAGTTPVAVEPGTANTSESYQALLTEMQQGRKENAKATSAIIAQIDLLALLLQENNLVTEIEKLNSRRSEAKQYVEKYQVDMITVPLTVNDPVARAQLSQQIGSYVTCRSYDVSVLTAQIEEKEKQLDALRLHINDVRESAKAAVTATKQDSETVVVGDHQEKESASTGRSRKRPPSFSLRGRYRTTGTRPLYPQLQACATASAPAQGGNSDE